MSEDLIPNPHEVGPVFASGSGEVGRGRRLPPGHVSLIGASGETVSRALREMLEYVGRRPGAPRVAMVYGEVGPGERDGYMVRLRERVGAGAFAERSATFDIRAGMLRVVDSQHVQHVWPRHHQQPNARNSGHEVVGVEELLLLPRLSAPVNVADFTVRDGQPCVEYRFERGPWAYWLIEAVWNGRNAMSVKTFYKTKKGRGGPPAG